MDLLHSAEEKWKADGPASDVAIGGGLAALGALLLVALGVLLGGRLLGGATRGRRHAEQPPEPGSIPSSRHRNVASNSAR